MWRISQASHDMQHQKVTILPENIFACCHINLLLFVHDMMNIHDPGVPAGSSQCPSVPRLADGAVSGVLSPHHLPNNWPYGKLF